MSLIEQTTRRPLTTTAKETVAAWRGFFFLMSMEAKIVWMMVAVVALWGLAILTFGVPALVWPMKLIFPGLVLSLVLLTWGM